MVTAAMTFVGKADEKSRKEELDSLFSRMKRTKKAFTSVASVREWFSGNGTNISYETARALWRRLVGRHPGAALIVTTADAGLDIPESPIEQAESATPIMQDAPVVAPVTNDPPPAVKVESDNGPARYTFSHGA